MNEVCVSKFLSAHCPVRLGNGVHFGAYTSPRKDFFVYTLLYYIYKCTHARTHARTFYLLRARNIFSLIITMLLFVQLATVKAQQAATQQYTVSGTAQMNFPINDGRIHADFGSNRQEIEKLNAIIHQVLADTTATMQRIVICGYGSPDGSYAFNERLAKKRADGLMASVAEKASFPKNIIEVRYVAEDWEGLEAFVEAASVNQLPHRNELLKVIRSNRSADAKERIIRKRYPADFKYLKNHGLQQLRRSDYLIEYLTRDPNAVQTMAQIQQGLFTSQSGNLASAGGLPNQDGSQSNSGGGQQNAGTPGGGSSGVQGGSSGVQGGSSGAQGHSAGAQPGSTDKLQQDSNQANQLAASQMGGQNGDSGIKWWMLLIGGLLLLALIAAGLMIRRYAALLDEKNATINRMKYELRLLKNAAMKREEEEKKHQPVSVPQAVVSQVPEPVVVSDEPVATSDEPVVAVPEEPVATVDEPVVASDDQKEEEIPVIPFVERPKTLVFGAESVVDDSERSFEDEKTTEEEPETTDGEEITVVEEPETTAAEKEENTVVEEPETTSEEPETVVDDEESTSEEDETADESSVEAAPAANAHDYERFLRMDKEVTEKKLYLDGNLNRRKLMRIAGVDKNRFGMMMRKYAKTNFSGYINAKRMEYAAQLITEHPEYTMKQVAEACGYNSQSTFFRVFKSVFDITPIELSQKSKQGESSVNQEVISFSKSPSGQNGIPREQMIKFGSDND